MPPNVERARKLRKEMSYPEVLLWQRLRRSPNGVRFRKQHPVGEDSIDFYCTAAKLAIDVDGEVHSLPGAPERDAERDRYLAQLGMRVIRVLARDVLQDADGAAAAIVELGATPHHHRPKRAGGPPPRSGEDRQ